MQVAVLASGRGSNFQSIIDASSENKLPNCKIGLLIVNKKEAYAIERAKKHNIPYRIIESKNNLKDSISEELEKLAALKEKGILTDEEFSVAKAKILNS